MKPSRCLGAWDETLNLNPFFCGQATAEQASPAGERWTSSEFADYAMLKPIMPYAVINFTEMTIRTRMKRVLPPPAIYEIEVPEPLEGPEHVPRHPSLIGNGPPVSAPCFRVWNGEGRSSGERNLCGVLGEGTRGREEERGAKSKSAAKERKEWRGRHGFHHPRSVFPLLARKCSGMSRIGSKSWLLKLTDHCCVVNLAVQVGASCIFSCLT